MPTEPAPPGQWPINNYWRESDERISQHWYISFCLMMSAVQDYLTGLVLQEKSNLNWATTCYYYSMVHTGRLITFCVIGDYPMQHKALRELYKAAFMPPDWRAEPYNQKERKAGSIDHIQFRWLNDFCGYPRLNIEPSVFSSKLSVLFSPSDCINSHKLNQFTGYLNRLGVLRTEANYESLLIAHEKHHVSVTDSFNRLVRSAQSAAYDGISLTISAYKTYVLNSPLLDLDHLSLFEDWREAFKTISNEYLLGRLYNSLNEKINDCENARKELDNYKNQLHFQINGEHDLQARYKVIERHIMMTPFVRKKLLMEKFSRKIEALENVNRIRAKE